MAAPVPVTVFNILRDSTGNPLANQRVNCVLNGNFVTVLATGDAVEPLQQTAITDGTGKYTFTVVPNDLLSPANTTYTIIEPTRSYDIAPQSTNGASQQTTAANVIVNVPSPLTPATSNLTGPLTVGGTLQVSGAVTLSALTQGQVVFPGAAGLLSGDTNLFWDNTNKRLGVGTSGPLSTLDVNGSAVVRGANFNLTAAPGELLMSGAGQAIIGGGTTGLAIWNNVLSLKNLDITDPGVVTLRNNLVLTGAPAVISGQGAGQFQIIGGTTGWAINNNANTQNNLAMDDSGNLTIRAPLITFLAATPQFVGGSGGTFFSNHANSQNNLVIGDAGDITVFRDVIALRSAKVAGDAGAGVASRLTLTNAVGLGNGAQTNITAPLIGTGSGPATPTQVVDFLKVYDGTSTRWIPVMA